MGSVPDWYLLIRAGRYLKVPAWELMDQHPAWIHWAVASENAESIAEKHHNDRAIQRAKAKSRSK